MKIRESSRKRAFILDKIEELAKAAPLDMQDELHALRKEIRAAFDMWDIEASELSVENLYYCRLVSDLRRPRGFVSKDITVTWNGRGLSYYPTESKEQTR